MSRLGDDCTAAESTRFAASKGVPASPATSQSSTQGIPNRVLLGKQQEHTLTTPWADSVPVLVEHGDFKGPESSYPDYLRSKRDDRFSDVRNNLFNRLFDLAEKVLDLGIWSVRFAIRMGAAVALSIILSKVLGVDPTPFLSELAKLLIK